MIIKNPYEIPRPAQISFSGGRSSAFMLWNILKAYKYNLPDDIYVIFANTGKENEETLKFIKDVEDNWDVNIHWIEFDVNLNKPLSKKRTDDMFWKEVNFDTASRDGEPFEKLIDYHKARRLQFSDMMYNQDNLKFVNEGQGFLPNPTARFCTDLLKIQGVRNFMIKKNVKSYTHVLGLRYDEPRRVASIKKKGTRKVEISTPMNDAKHTKEDIFKFWNDYWFDLDLPNINGETPHGNCDLCFLKGRKKTESLIREKPEKADWWIRMEEKNKNVFRRDRPSYKKLKEIIEISPMLFDDENDDGDLGDCFCTD
tara:strand:- start:1242 stop:2177 length:936 start_codon:yes stop_codon:yes gene_type:complete